MTATDYVNYLVSALNYNRMTDCTIEICHRVLHRIDNEYTWRSEHKYDNYNINDDVDLLASAIFLAYGECGISPRHGWIVDEDYNKAIKTALVNRIQDLAHEYMEELLNDARTI